MPSIHPATVPAEASAFKPASVEAAETRSERVDKHRRRTRSAVQASFQHSNVEGQGAFRELGRFERDDCVAHLGAVSAQHRYGGVGRICSKTVLVGVPLLDELLGRDVTGQPARGGRRKRSRLRPLRTRRALFRSGSRPPSSRRPAMEPGPVGVTWPMVLSSGTWGFALESWENAMLGASSRLPAIGLKSRGVLRVVDSVPLAVGQVTAVAREFAGRWSSDLA